MSEASGMSAIKVPMAQRHAASRSRSGGQFLRLAPLAFNAALFTDFLYELRGYDDIAVLGSYHLHGADIATAMGLLAVMAFRPGLGRLNATKFLVIAIACVVALSIFRGMLESPFDAFYAFRPRAVTLIALFYVTFSRERLEPISHFERWLIFWVCIITGLFFLRSVFGPTLFLAHDSVAYTDIANLEFRSLNSETVLILGLAMIMFLDMIDHTKDFKKRQLYIVLAISTFLIIVLSRQRTSGLAGLVGLTVFFFADYKFLRRHPLAVMLVVELGLMAFVISATGLLPTLIDALPTVFKNSLEKTATLESRQQIWAFALNSRFANWDIIRQLFGPPSGEPLFIVLKSGLWQHSLHSQYVATIMNYGICGALAWSLLVFYTILGALRALRKERANRLELPPRIVLAWLAALLIYGFSYEWSDGAGFFVAVALAGWSPRDAPKMKSFSPVGRLTGSHGIGV